ncbi:hypothetical protein Goshw_028487 [Gossypium schwendimanii]|uniref:Uncharacterized protein n=1 Tax=Gossypium schwendimanii TaxID=34291 RepID=A0A7J9MXP5_GOSSC|nr:hypothetical protein [Gossypium schwendimanii]
MWEDRYDYIPTREPIIILELACVSEYMPCFKIHGKPYLLWVEERQRQLRVQREPAPIQSPGPVTAPALSPDPVIQSAIPMVQPFQMIPSWSLWPGLSLFFITPSGL